MNPLHLFWVVPLFMTVGAFITAVLIGGTKYDDYYDHDVSGLLEED